MFEDLDLVCITWGLRALESSLELIGRQSIEVSEIGYISESELVVVWQRLWNITSR